MATTPTYPGATKRFGSVQITNGTGTSNTGSALAGVAAGTKVREIRICSGPTTAPGGTYKIAVLLDDGSTVKVIDIVTLTNAVDTLQATLRYDNLVLPSTAHLIKFASRTTITSGATLDCTVMGEDY